jgi:serpin B
MKISNLLIPLLSFPTLVTMCQEEMTPSNFNIGSKTGNSQFAFSLYKEIGKTPGNQFISPYSISTAMAMTYAGAKGETRDEMSQVLGLSPEQGKVDSDFRNLNYALFKKSKDIEVKTSNALWMQENFTFREDYKKIITENYSGALNTADFKNDKNREAAIVKINGWVNGETNGKIIDLIPPGSLSSLTRLVLVNAIYFKGNWQNKFSENNTADGIFYSDGQKQVTIPFMHGEFDVRYLELDDLKGVELPYVDNKYNMLILLPKKNDGLASLESQLTYDNYQQWISMMMKEEVTISLPKFTLTESYNLENTLQSMGMTQAFSDQADFSGITGKPDLKISKVLHKAFIEVNEEGTEAAAATGVVMVEKSARHEKLSFTADHPFIFFIRENTTGTILFMGRVARPELCTKKP